MMPGTIQRKNSVVQKVAGWSLLAAGLSGLVLPVIPGIPLLFAGLATLSSQHRWARQLMVRLKRRSHSAWSALASKRHNI